MTKKNFLLSPIIFFIINGLAYAGQVNLVTYYPAPTGAYNQINLQAQPATFCTGGRPDGTLFLMTTGTTQSLSVCQGGTPQPVIHSCYNIFCSYRPSIEPVCNLPCPTGSPVSGTGPPFQTDNTYFTVSIVCCQ